jgi:hypothetical protein
MHQVMAYADDVNLLRDDIDTINKNTDTLIEASMEVDLEVEKTKYTLLSHHQSVHQYWDTKIANRTFENVAQCIYFGTTVTNQNLIQEEIERRLNFGNACCHSFLNRVPSCLLSKKKCKN